MTRQGFAVQAPFVQDALGSRIADQLPAGVPCSVGYPAGGLQAEHVWVSGAFDASLPLYVSGGFQRDEAGDIEVRVSVVWSDSDMGGPRDRALELAQFVEDAISVDPTLGGVVQEAHVASVRGDEAAPEEHSRQYGLVLRVAYTATVALD